MQYGILTMALGKKKKSIFEDLVAGILDSCDTDVIVLDRDLKNLLYINSIAMSQLDESNADISEYLAFFPGILEACAKSYGDGYEPAPFEISHVDKRHFSVKPGNIEWVDSEPATILFIRDSDTELRAKETLYKLAYHDFLTDIPNRLKFKEDFEALHKDIEDGKLAGIVAIFDLDNFKTINDTYGHNTGDIMLKRLTEFLQGQPEFKGHLYRLGGDEFVFFFAQCTEVFDSEASLRNFYKNILDIALRSYTMPNIEQVCTLSIGVALLPTHGTNFSELLRKADIALYQAKAAGRNQMCFFEEQYDSAKKFKDLYVNINPILMSSGRTYGYELLDRGGDNNTENDDISLSGFDRTFDALGLDDLNNDSVYFISNSMQLTSSTVLKNLPKDKFVIQIQLPRKLTQYELTLYKKLQSLGYKLCFGGLRRENATQQLLSMASFCKMELSSVDQSFVMWVSSTFKNVDLIATEVDSPAAFDTAHKYGFKLFQGYFFNKPVIVKNTKEISPLKFNYYRLLKLTSTEQYVDFKEISSIISSDVAMSYKLLKLLNSAAMGMRSKISSISMAVAYLGEDQLKKWIAMLALRGIGDDKPLELVRISLIRAHFGELLAPRFLNPRESTSIFLLGLLSLLHVALEKSKEELFKEIPVSDDIRDSILTKTGKYSDIVEFFSNYEYSNWELVSDFAKARQLPVDFINDCYVDSVKWYNALSKEA